MKTLEKTALLTREREAIEAAINKLRREFPVEKIVLSAQKPEATLMSTRTSTC